MFIRFFEELREANVPVSLREYLTLLEALDSDVIESDVEDFYYLSRSALVKDERNLDKFDRVFGHVFQGLDMMSEGEIAEIPEEWLKKLTEKFLTEEEKEQIEALGGWEKIMEELKKRLDEQTERHEGGNKWIGTGGTSPFGAYGYNPEGVRIGQKEGRHGKAVKVWDKRVYKNLDDQLELGTRNIKVALRRLACAAGARGAGSAGSAGILSTGGAGIGMRTNARPSVARKRACCRRRHSFGGAGGRAVPALASLTIGARCSLEAVKTTLMSPLTPYHLLLSTYHLPVTTTVTTFRLPLTAYHSPHSTCTDYRFTTHHLPLTL